MNSINEVAGGSESNPSAGTSRVAEGGPKLSSGKVKYDADKYVGQGNVPISELINDY